MKVSKCDSKMGRHDPPHESSLTVKCSETENPCRMWHSHWIVIALVRMAFDMRVGFEIESRQTGIDFHRI